MATNKYVGSRYVPKYFGAWNAATAYEALSIVSDAEGVYTYTSKRPVPAGTPVSNTTYWAQSGTLSESMQMGVISHVDSTKADDANISANKLNLTFASDFTMNDSTEKALNLDTTVQSGTYGINPSLCQNVPEELKTSADVCQLYVYVLNVDKYTQTLVCPKKGTQYVRINDGTGWSPWLMTGFTPAYATKQGAGLVQLGDGLKAENASGLTSIDHDATLHVSAGKVGVMVGEHMETDGSGAVSPMIASTANPGIVQVGDGLSVTPEGVLSAAGASDEWVEVPVHSISALQATTAKVYKNERTKICQVFVHVATAKNTSSGGNYTVSNMVNFTGLPMALTADGSKYLYIAQTKLFANLGLHIGFGLTNDDATNTAKLYADDLYVYYISGMNVLQGDFMFFYRYI